MLHLIQSHNNNRLQVLFIVTCFDSTESSSGYDFEPYVFTRYSRAFWDPQKAYTFVVGRLFNCKQMSFFRTKTEYGMY